MKAKTVEFQTLENMKKEQRCGTVSIEILRAWMCCHWSTLVVHLDKIR